MSVMWWRRCSFCPARSGLPASEGPAVPGPGGARRQALGGLLGLALGRWIPAEAQPGDDPTAALTDAPAMPAPPLAAEFRAQVRPALDLPPAEQQAYAGRLQGALDAAGTVLPSAQFVLLIDRHPQVQAALLYWGAPAQGWQWVGAAPVSTGKPGLFEHFETPLGVFDHHLGNPDFRAEGTKNEFGFRGYGRKGLRVYDLGWVWAQRGWGARTMGWMRLQVHATDPELGEPFLGSARSAGCVRIPATLNDFLDRHAVLDADYARALAQGQSLWVLRPDRTPTATPGRRVVVVDSGRSARPEWSPLPKALQPRAPATPRPPAPSRPG